MSLRHIILAGLLAGQGYTQEAPAVPQSKPAPLAFRVLQESVIRQRNGDTLTFKRVEPPVLPVEAAVPVQQPVLTAAEAARAQRQEQKESSFLSVSASVQADGRTLLRWWPANGGEGLQAVSNVDFRYLAGIGSFETEKCVYSLFMGIGPDEKPLAPELAALAQRLPADGRPAFVMPQAGKGRTPAELQAVAAMEALHDYFEANREMLMQQHAQREVERAARELAERNAPPPGPRKAVIHFWPLQPEQRAAIQQAEREKRTAADAEEMNATRQVGVKP